LDTKQLANANITGAADLVGYAPLLSINPRFGNDNATFSIRGFTQELRTTPAVAIYMAEVVAPRGQSAQTSGDGAGPGALFDLQNVQVLKGPQGTLFGRNTTGGAVLLVPNRPTDAFGGYVELSAGELGMQRQQAVINVPLSERFRSRLGVDRYARDGHLDNVTDIGASELGDADYLSARLSTVWDLTETLENYTILSYIDSDSNGVSSRLFACNPNPQASPLSLLTGPPCQQQLDDQAATGQDGFYDIVSTIKTPVTAITEKRLINTTSWSVTDQLSLKAILAYAHLYTENGSDIFGTQFRLAIDPDPRRELKLGISAINPDIPVTSQKTWVAELQVQGDSFDGALVWQGGLYYENSLPDGFSGGNSAAFLSCEVATIEGDPSQFNCFDPTAGQLGSALVVQYKTEYLNRAVYAQGTYHLSDRLALTAGLRYTWDRSEGYGIKTRYTFVGSVPQEPREQITTPSTSSQAPTGLLELSYRPLDGVMAYAKYVRGYRQGNVILAADPGVDTFEPEKVDTYEIGAKTSFGGLVPGRFNFAVFYNDLTDQQLQLGYISPSAGTTTTIANAGKSRVQGLEAEAYFQLLDSLTLSLSYSYLDTELLEQEDYTERVADAGGPLARLTATPIADVGEELPYAPDQSYVASLNWRLPLPPRIGELGVGATYAYIGRQRSGASSASPYGLLDAYDLLNLNLNWSAIFGTPLDLAVFGTNVLDAQYVTYISATYNNLGFETRMSGMPRLIGARLKYSFGATAP
ncbi:MAG: TonB-dependent receptor, partial [Gammaproteobacteria bacterium]